MEVHASIYEVDACFDSGRTYMVAVPMCPPPVTADANKVLYVRVRVDGYYEDGAVWCPVMISCPGIVEQLGLLVICMHQGDCSCYLNGIPLSAVPTDVSHGDFVAIYKSDGRRVVPNGLLTHAVAGTACKHDSSWPLGHVLLLPGSGPKSVCYIGAAAPKLLLIVNAARPQAPEVYVVEAIAYRRTIQLGRLPIACQKSWPSKQLRPDTEFNIEYRDGQGVLNVGAYHCQQEGCLSCFLTESLQLAYCPWHPSTSRADAPSSQGVFHLFYTKNPGDSTVDLIGQLVDSPSTGAIHLFHVCTAEQIHQLGARLQPVQNKISIFTSSLAEAPVSDVHLEFLELPFQDVALPREIYRHLFVKAGGLAFALDVWLRCRSQV